MKRIKYIFITISKKIIYMYQTLNKARNISMMLFVLTITGIISMSEHTMEKAYAATQISNVSATASSYMSPYTPDKAIDADAINAQSRWYVSGDQKWLQLDLKQNYYINRWVVTNLGAAGWEQSCNTNGYKLQGSVDGVNWQEYDVITNNTGNITDRGVNPFLARYVVLDITKGNLNNNDWASILDFKVYAAATVSSVSVPGNGSYTAGQALDFTVNFNEAVNIIGTDSTLNLDIGGMIRQAIFKSKTANSVTYSYTIQAGDTDTDGITVGNINLNTTTILDGSSNNVVTTLNNVENTSGILVKTQSTVTIASLIGGNITASSTLAGEGNPITLNVLPNSGMRLKEGTLKYNDGTDHYISGTSFLMPNTDVTVSAEFEPIPLTLNSDIVDGTIVKSGSSVILTSETGATIYYTMGTNPDDPIISSSSILSGESISLIGLPGETVKVKAYAVKSGITNSEIITFTYYIQPSQNLTVTGITAEGKIYDGTTNATIIGSPVLSGVSAGNLVNIYGTPIAEFMTKDVSDGKSIIVSGYTISGPDAGYYNLVQPTLTANITKKDIIISGINANNKIYDGNTSATLDTIGAVFSYKAAGDNLTVDTSSADIQFDSASVGNGKVVNVSGLKLGGIDKDNYNLTNTTLILAANIESIAVTPGINSVTVTPENTMIVKGGSQQLSANVSSTGGADNTVSWSSNDVNNKVTVDSTGFVSVAADAAPGNYTITARSIFDSSKIGIANIAVTIDPGLPVTPIVNNVIITPSSASIVQGENIQLNAIVDATMPMPPNAVTWTSNDANNKVTVDNTGLVSVTADAAPGSYTITATSMFDSSKSATATITVTANTGLPVTPAVNRVTVNTNSLFLQLGQSAPLFAFVEAVGGADSTVIWSSNDADNKVTVDQNGLVNVALDATPKSYTITARSFFDSSKYAEVIVNILEENLPPVNPPAPIIINQPSNLKLTKGSTASFTTFGAGIPQLSYQWEKDGIELIDDSRVNGSQSTILQIENIRNSDEGDYICTLTDGIGNVTTSSAARLIVTTTSSNHHSKPTNTNDTNTSNENNANNSNAVNTNYNEESVLNAMNDSTKKIIVINGDNVPLNNNTPLISEAILNSLKANLDKTLIIKIGDSTINIKNNEGQLQFTENGNVISGFRLIGNSEYYFNTNGIMQKGWIQPVDNTWYYLDQVTGSKKIGWIQDMDDSWYYLDKTTGVMKAGWIQVDDGVWYYLDRLSGGMKTGWIKDGETWYYLNPNGSLAVNTTVDGYTVDENGGLIS